MKNLSGMTDEELALSYGEGNNRAFDMLLARNQTKLFSYILFVVRDREVANDIFQETFVKVITKLQQRKYATSGKFSAWIMRIAHNAIIDWYREQKVGKVVEFSKDNDLSNTKLNSMVTSNINSYYDREQVLDNVKNLMNLLPSAQREVVFMRYYQEMSFKEIAEQTNVSINTALGRMRYAIMNIRKMAKANNTALQIE